MIQAFEGEADERNCSIVPNEAKQEKLQHQHSVFFGSVNRYIIIILFRDIQAVAFDQFHLRVFPGRIMVKKD